MEQWAADIAAPGEQLGVRCLAQGSHLSRGHFMPEPGFEPTTSAIDSGAPSVWSPSSTRVEWSWKERCIPATLFWGGTQKNVRHMEILYNLTNQMTTSKLSKCFQFCAICIVIDVQPTVCGHDVWGWDWWIDPSPRHHFFLYDNQIHLDVCKNIYLSVLMLHCNINALILSGIIITFKNI